MKVLENFHQPLAREAQGTVDDSHEALVVERYHCCLYKRKQLALAFSPQKTT